LITHHSKPRVTSPWRLRYDGNYLISYECTTSELKFKIFTIPEAAIIYFFNGKLTYKDIQELWLDINNVCPDKKKVWLESLDAIVDDLIKSGVIALEGEVSPSLSGGEALLIPDFSSYSPVIQRTTRPISVNIAFTNKCSTDCIYCYEERKDCHEFTFNQLIRVFDQLTENSVYIVDILGGDFFTRPDALALLEEMVARDFIFFLSSKCYFSRQKAEKLARMGIGIDNVPPHLKRPLQISIDTTDNEIASFLTGRKDYFKHADESVGNLLKAGISPRIKCVLTSYNSDAPEPLLQHFIEKGVTEFQFVQYGRSFYRHNGKLFLTKEQKLRLRDKFALLKEKFPEIEIIFQDDVSTGEYTHHKSYEKWNDRAVCSGGRTNLLLMPNGDVILCDQIPHKPEYVVGNILEQDLMDIWNGKKLLEFLYPSREYFKGSVCYTCPDFDECHQIKGYCYREALFSYGTIYDAPPECPRQSKKPVRLI
jgi:radical SAM protein with 4Fe4S-binding SPASM domain